MRQLAIVVIVLALTLAVSAAVPETMSYQGVLRDGTGAPVPDGTYTVAFRLYDAAAGGTELWTEEQSVATSGGIFNAVLGSVTPLAVPFDEPYWLGIQVESEPELAPRAELTSTPYAMRATYGDLALPYSGAVWSAGPVFEVENTGTNEVARFIGVSAGDQVEIGMGDWTGNALRLSGSGTSAKIGGGTSTSRNDIVIDAVTGNVGIGLLPQEKLHVDGRVLAEDVKLTSGATSGHVLTSDADGVASWQPPAAGSDGDWTVAGDDMYSGAAGNVGIGTATPEVKLHVRDEVAGGVLYATKLDNPSAVAGTAVGVLFKVDGGQASETRGKGGLVYERTDTWNRGSFHFLQDNGVTYANPDLADAVMTIDNDGRVGIGTTAPAELLEVAGTVHSTSGGFKFPDGTVQMSTASGGLVLPYSNSTTSADEVFDISNDGTGTAIIGTHTSTGNYGRLGGPMHGVYGLTNVSSGAGVYAKHEGSGSAVFANAPGGTGVEASSGSGSGVWATSSTGDALHAITYNGRALYAEDADGKTAVLCDADYGVSADNTAGTEGHIAGGQYGVYGGTSVNNGAGVYGKHNGTGVAVYANAPNGTGVEASSGSGSGVWATSSTGDALHAISLTGYAGYFEGGIRTDGFEYPTGASNGYALTSNATGNATWQRLGPGGLADPMDFGSQTWDWEFTSGRLDMDITAGYPVLDLTNSSASGYGGVALFRSTSTTVSSAGTRALRVTTQRGNAGSFQKYISDGYSAVDIFADSSTGLGLYVSGTITSTAKSARGVKTARGTEPVFAAETVEPEIYDSGEAFLSGGRATITFDQLFTDAVSKEARVRVTVTPVGGWSALYLESTGPEGFVVRSAEGDPDIEFFWTACGLCRDHEAARQITFPDPDEIARVEREQEAAIGS